MQTPVPWWLWSLTVLGLSVFIMYIVVVIEQIAKATAKATWPWVRSILKGTER